MDTGENLFKVFPVAGDLPFLFPGEKKHLLDGFITLDHTIGKEYVCLLFSLHPLNNNLIVSKMERSAGTFSQRLYRVLGSRLLPLDNIQYLEGESLTFKGRLQEGEVIPVMLAMDHNG